MEGGPAPNAYHIPPTLGCEGHTPTKHRFPSMTIGRLCVPDPVKGHGLMYNIRDHTRYGKLHMPKNGFGARRLIATDTSPAPNLYHPRMDFVRPKAPAVAFKSRVYQGCVQAGNPSPNTYTLEPAIVLWRPKTACQLTVAPRFKEISEGNPAPNNYTLPEANAYKYGRTANTRMYKPGTRPRSRDVVPSPNQYHLPAAKKPGNTFGQKPSYRRNVYMTVEDFGC